MRGNREQRKRTRRASVCAFVLTMMLLGFAGGLYTVDTVTGRTLHGASYRPTVDTAAVSAWLPARLRVLWEMVSGNGYFLFFTALEEGNHLSLKTSASNTSMPRMDKVNPMPNPFGE